MNLLVDSHIILWLFFDRPQLSAKARQALNDATLSYVSAASIWEIGIKRALGKLESPEDIEDRLQQASFIALPVLVSHAIAAARLPRHHADPFDRMLIAQASLESLTLLTADRRLQAYDVPILLV